MLGRARVTACDLLGLLSRCSPPSDVCSSHSPRGDRKIQHFIQTKGHSRGATCATQATFGRTVSCRTPTPPTHARAPAKKWTFRATSESLFRTRAPRWWSFQHGGRRAGLFHYGGRTKCPAAPFNHTRIAPRKFACTCCTAAPPRTTASRNSFLWLAGVWFRVKWVIARKTADKKGG